jgi:hypothetical protein
MPELPTTFGKYYLTEKLATGGMAEIYLAKLIGPGGFERFVVIKQILPKLSGQRHFVDLFVAEAKTLVSLAHGNIVPVYELGVVDETYFIAMDYIDGPTLYRLTEIMSRRDARMEPAVAAWITARILEGLDYAHRKGEGVIHRDLSPRNVMLSRDGDVKIVDFGIAVVGDGTGDEAHQSAPTGSFPYMSPEQVRREPLTAQTDLFTVGVLFWEMLTGTRLFARAEADATLEAVLTGAIVTPSAARADVPARLDALAMRALERDQGARWATAGEMLAALNKYLYSLDATPGPREVAALVARHCPPETRRMPTNMDGDAGDAIAASDASAASGPAAGPSTAVIPRDAVARGRKHVRHQTFATHVELREMLGADEPVTTAAPKPTPSVGPDRDDDRPIPRPDRPGLRLDTPPRRSTLVIIGLGGIVLAASVVYMVRQRADRVLYLGVQDAGVFRDAPALVLETESQNELDANPAGSIDGAGAPDAAVVVVSPPAPTDAGRIRVARDAAHAEPDAQVASAAGTATLTLGANPWAKVFIDGKEQRKHAPNTFEVSAGHHELRLVFDGEGPAAEKTYAIDVKAGETPSLQADFSAH